MEKEIITEKSVVKIVDNQYKNLVIFILENGERVPTPQDVDAFTCFGTAPTLIYDLENGDPIITERKMGVKGPIAEMCAFINGEQNVDVMKEKYGLPEAFWGPWVVERKTQKVGAKPRHLGDGSYGRAFAAFPTPDGGTLVLPTADYKTPDGRRIEGVGVSPAGASLLVNGQPDRVVRTAVKELTSA